MDPWLTLGSGAGREDQFTPQNNHKPNHIHVQRNTGEDGKGAQRPLCISLS